MITYLALMRSSRDELTSAGYCRQAICLVPHPSIPDRLMNRNAVRFAAAPVDWGLVNHVAIMDAPMGGKSLAVFPTTEARHVLTGDHLLYRTGHLIIARRKLQAPGAALE